MFTAARLKLTAWYLVILTVITGLFSLAIYRYSVSELHRSLVQQSRRFLAVPLYLEEEFMTEIKQRIALRLALINLIILAVSGIAAYFLAGETLRPIEETIESQKRFIADASHELKTPLTSLKTEIEVALRDKKLSLAEAKSLLKSNLEETDKLKNFTDYLLSLSRYDTAGPHLTKEPVDLAEAVQSAINRHRALLQSKNLTLDPHLLPVTLSANPAALTELASILLDNAVKYTPAGGHIDITVKRSGRKALLTVSDTGIGIKPADLPHIFDRFYRADSSRSKMKADGYGLGLSIAKSIATAHGGDITAVSTPDRTVFTAILPL